MARVRGRANPIKFNERSNPFAPMDFGDTDRINPLPFVFDTTAGNGGGNGNGGGGDCPPCAFVYTCDPSATLERCPE